MTSPKDVADAVQAVPGIGTVLAKIYDDLLSPTTKQVGRSAGAMAEAILTGPTELFITVTQAQQWLGAHVRARMDQKGINPDRIIPPDPQIYIGSVAGMISSGHVAELREMFGNLMASSMDEAMADLSHPSFPEIIRQLSPLEARMIQHLRLEGYIPAVWVRGNIQQNNSEFAAGGPFARFPEEGDDSVVHTAGAFQNLARLGLVDLVVNRTLSESHAYDGIESHEIIRSVLTREPVGFERMHLRRGVVEISGFGTRFGSVVVADAGPCPPPAMLTDLEFPV